MKLYKVMISYEAKNDLTNIINYIENFLKEPSIARKYFNIIKKTNIKFKKYAI